MSNSITASAAAASLYDSDRVWWQRPHDMALPQWRALAGSAITISVIALLMTAWGTVQVATNGLWTEVPVAFVGMVGTALLPQPVLRDRGRYVSVPLVILMAPLLTFGVHFAVLAAVMAPMAAGYAWRCWWLSRRTLSPVGVHLLMYAVWVGAIEMFVVIVSLGASNEPPPTLLPRIPFDWALPVLLVMLAAGLSHVAFPNRRQWLVTVPVMVMIGYLLPVPPLDLAVTRPSLYPHEVGNQHLATNISMLVAVAVYVWGIKALRLETRSERTGLAWIMLADGIVMLTAFMGPAWYARFVLVDPLPPMAAFGVVIVVFWATTMGFIVLMRAAQHRRAFTAYRRFLADRHHDSGPTVGDPLQPIVQSAFEHLTTCSDVTHAMVITTPTRWRAGRLYAAEGMIPDTAVHVAGEPVSDTLTRHVDAFRAHPAVKSIPLRRADGSGIGELLVASSGLPISLQVRGSVEGFASLLAVELAAVDQQESRSIPATWQHMDTYLTDNLISETLLRHVAAEWSRDTDTGHGACVAHFRIHAPIEHRDTVALLAGSILLETLAVRPNLLARDDGDGYLALLPQRFPKDGDTRCRDAWARILDEVADRCAVPATRARAWVQVATVNTPRLTPHTADTAIDTVKSQSQTMPTPLIAASEPLPYHHTAAAAVITRSHPDG